MYVYVYAALSLANFNAKWDSYSMINSSSAVFKEELFQGSNLCVVLSLSYNCR